MSHAAILPPTIAARNGLLATVPVLAAGLLILGLVFSNEVAAAIGVWTNSTAYNHCFFVIPIAAYIAWDRRALLHGAQPRPDPLLALAAVPLALAWLCAERVGVMEARQLIAMCLVQVLFIAVLGMPTWRRMSAALLYLFFLVPFGAFAVPLLQTVTARFTVAGLNVLGIPNYSDGFTIDIPEGSFFVAEACAGLRFLIASIAFGALYSSLIYRSPSRRVAFMAASVVIPVIANGVRATGIVALGHVLGSAEAAAADHVLYGWIFFSIVLVLLILVGLPFRQEPHFLVPVSPTGPPRAATPTAAAVAALVVIAGAAGSRAVAFGLDRVAGHSRSAAALAFDTSYGCRTVSPPNEAPRSGSVLIACASGRLQFETAVFSPKTSLSQIATTRREVSREAEGADGDTEVLWSGGTAWRLTTSEDPPGAVATALWIDGRPARGGIATRLAQARNSLLGSENAPVLAVIRPEIDWAREGQAGRQHARSLVQSFLDSQPELGAQLSALAGGPAPEH